MPLQNRQSYAHAFASSTLSSRPVWLSRVRQDEVSPAAAAPHSFYDTRLKDSCQQRITGFVNESRPPQAASAPMVPARQPPPSAAMIGARRWLEPAARPPRRLCQLGKLGNGRAGGATQWQGGWFCRFSGRFAHLLHGRASYVGARAIPPQAARPPAQPAPPGVRSPRRSPHPCPQVGARSRGSYSA
jgi:hypothetical protein